MLVANAFKNLLGKLFSLLRLIGLQGNQSIKSTALRILDRALHGPHE